MDGAAHPMSESKVSTTLLCQLHSTCYTAVRIKNCLKSISVIKVANMKNTDNFHYAKKANTCNGSPNQHFLLPTKMIGDTKEGTGKSMKNTLYVPKGTSRIEVTSNSENIN